MPFVSRTRATFRSAEFGFFGVWVKTRTQTPRFCGLFCSAGLLVLLTIFFRPARTSWLIVGINETCHLVIWSGRPPVTIGEWIQSMTRRPDDQMTKSTARLVRGAPFGFQ